MTIVERLKQSQIAAMKAKQKDRLQTLRLALAAVKQREVDERVEITDSIALELLTKMVKQRNESISQYEQAGRQDLADKEKAEILILEEFLPQPMTDSEIEQAVQAAFDSIMPNSMQDMGKVMAALKPVMQGRADMAKVSQLIKQKLS